MVEEGSGEAMKRRRQLPVALEPSIVSDGCWNDDDNETVAIKIIAAKNSLIAIDLLPFIDSICRRPLYV